MKVLVTGVNGQLGHDVMLQLARRGHNAIGSGSGERYKGTDDLASMAYQPLDICDNAAVLQTLEKLHPDAVIHCSAWTAVDAAEELENRDKVFALNVKGPENIAKACRTVEAKMVYVSTDYVFGGEGEAPWKPDCKAFQPLNVYGETKLAGEFTVSGSLDSCFVVRTAWVFGKNGKNFVKTMLNSAKTHSEVRVVCDQFGTPTYTQDLARLLVDMIETEKYGYYHATNEGGYISWSDFAEEIFRQAGMDTRVIPVTTTEYGLSKATRPHNSRLDKSKLREAGFEPLPDWKNALSRYLKEIQENGTDSSRA